MSDILVSLKFGKCCRKSVDGKADDKNNYLVPEMVDWGLKAPLKSDNFGVFERAQKKRQEKQWVSWAMTMVGQLMTESS